MSGKNPRPGNSPQLGFSTSKSVYWGSVYDSFGAFQNTALYSGQAQTGIEVWKCDVPSTTTCTGNWVFVQFVGETMLGTTDQEFMFFDKDNRALIIQNPGILYTLNPHGMTAGSVQAQGTGNTDWGNPNNPADPYYMQIKRIYALWP